MPNLSLDEMIQLATQHHRAGQFAEAEGLYRRVLAERPEDANATRLLGILASQCGKHEDAVMLLARATELTPTSAVAFHDLAGALRVAGRLGDAADVLRRLIMLRPGSADLYLELGRIERQVGRLPEAAQTFEMSLVFQPGSAEALDLLGVTLADQQRYEEAIERYRKALELDPAFARTHNILGTALVRMGDPAAAEQHHRRAVELDPAYILAHCNLASDLIQQQKLDEAQRGLDLALIQWPDSADLHCALSWIQRLRGDLPRGWDEHEWRWRLAEFTSHAGRFSQPLWDGGDLAGKTILLHFEGGYGDTIQFARYATLVAGRGGRVLLHCQEPLARLLKTVDGVDRVITTLDPLPEFDVHCPLLTLPHVFQTTLASIPAKAPYVSAPVELVRKWEQKLAGEEKNEQSKGLKIKRIGLAWSGNPKFGFDRLRSLMLSMLGPLGGVAGVQFYSLQVGEGAEQLASPPAGLVVKDYTAEIGDFADTAALMKNLDLIVSHDSAVAHLAGALGRPSVVLLPYAPDWRWLLERKDSPWYPSVRLFRQKKAGEWGEVVERVARSIVAANQPAKF